MLKLLAVNRDWRRSVYSSRDEEFVARRTHEWGSLRSGMLLSAEKFDWLRSNLPGSVAVTDLQSAYSFTHTCNNRRELVSQKLKPGGRGGMMWQVDFFDESGSRSLEQPLSRSVYPDLPLFGGPQNGPVVYNHALFPVAGCRNQRLATVLYDHEARLYAKWGVREIHMYATVDGPVVWVKRFGFLPKEPQALQVAYRSWARRWQPPETGAQERPPLEPPERPVDYPEAFLRTRPDLMLYKVIA